MRASHAAGALASLVSEDAFMAQVVELARLMGWADVHWRPARTLHGWRTPGSGTLAKGWVDLELHKPGRETLYVELKSQDGRLSPDQRRVHDFLRSCGRSVHVWRPADLPTTVLGELSR